MPNVFRILIYAVAAIAVLWVFLTYFAPYFFLQEDIAEKMSEGLETAEIQEGNLIKKNFIFKEGDALSAKTFDSSIRNVIFVCNNPSLCCGEIQVCPADSPCTPDVASCRINITPQRTLSITKNTETEVYFRCVKEYNLFDCKVTFGFRPGELVAETIELKDSYNLDAENPVLNFSIGNSGEIDSYFIGGWVNVYRKEKSGVEIIEVLHKEHTLDVVSKIAPGEAGDFSVDLGVNNAGEYIVKARVESDYAGYYYFEREFEVLGNAPPDDCKAFGNPSAAIEEGCYSVTKLPCTGCEYEFQCSAAWRAKGYSDAEIESPEYAVVKTLLTDKPGCGS